MVSKKTGRKKKRASTKKAAAARANGKKGGRPRRELDHVERDFLDAMCGAAALEEDIAQVLKIDRNTLNAICKRDYGVGFSAYRAQKMGMGRARLAAKQLEVALDGNVVMLIWLGKQWLQQTEPPQEKRLTGKDGKPLEVRTFTGWTDAQVDMIKRRILGIGEPNGTAGGTPAVPGGVGS